jgi:hypothetical protein
VASFGIASSDSRATRRMMERHYGMIWERTLRTTDQTRFYVRSGPDAHRGQRIESIAVEAEITGADAMVWNGLCRAIRSGELDSMYYKLTPMEVPELITRNISAYNRPPDAQIAFVLPAVANAMTSIGLSKRVVASGVAPFFPIVMDIGGIRPTTEMTRAELRRRLQATDDVWYVKGMGRPYEVLGRLWPQSVTWMHGVYVVREEYARVTIGDVIRTLRGSDLIRFLRALLLQVTVATETARHVIGFVHGMLRAENVTLQPVGADIHSKSWWIRGLGNWKCLPPSDHRGLLVKITNFDRSLIEAPASFGSPTLMASVYSPRWAIDHSWADLQTIHTTPSITGRARDYDTGVFIWSLSRHLTSVMLESMTAADATTWTDLMVTMKRIADSDYVTRETRDALMMAQRPLWMYLRETGFAESDIEKFTRAILQPRAGDLLNQSMTYRRVEDSSSIEQNLLERLMDWVDTYVVPRHSESPTRIRPRGSRAERSKRVTPMTYEADRDPVFKCYEAKEAHICPPWMLPENGVVIASRSCFGERVQFRRSCEQCGAAFVASGVEGTRTCSRTCAMIMEGKMKVITSLQLLFSHEQIQHPMTSQEMLGLDSPTHDVMLLEELFRQEAIEKGYVGRPFAGVPRVAKTRASRKKRQSESKSKSNGWIVSNVVT